MGSFINVFLPSTLIVAVSWISFWIRVEAAPARVALSVTSLLTLCTQVQNHKSQLPSLNYIIALDIWLFVCIFMVFATLVEFAISYNSYVIKRVQLSRNSGPEGTEKSPKAKPNGSWMLNVDESDNNSVVSSQASKRNWWLCGLVLRNVTRVDLASRVLFPLTFSVFAITYWAYYLLIYNKE
ncbi:glycine receptor subunit alpha-2 [Trichonephila clavata]|uniref:Glycine receptor subunit alpha-2 n=1 Tax=Trichonephila clavata TaxID=2740835 RepID=A0A8X6GE50_TRICU|nr:glycine receptor subunit alpha-2 [Trichonephila clavata]